MIKSQGDGKKLKEGRYSALTKSRSRARANHYRQLSHSVLDAISRSGSNTSVEYLAKELQLNYSALSKVIDELLNNKFIQLIDQSSLSEDATPDQIVLSLTPLGQSVANTMTPSKAVG